MNINQLTKDDKKLLSSNRLIRENKARMSGHIHTAENYFPNYFLNVWPNWHLPAQS